MYNQHGNYSIEVIDNIILLKMIYSFNELSIVQFTTEIKNIINTFEGRPFSYLINALECTGVTPVAFEEDNKFNKWLNTQNFLGKAIVHKSNVLMKISLNRESALSSQNIREFDNEHDGIIWLKSLNQY